MTTRLNNINGNTGSSVFRDNRDDGDDADVLRIKSEGWTVLADAQVRDDKSN